MISHTIKIANYPFGKKAAKLFVQFRSIRTDTDPAPNIPSGGGLNGGGVAGSTLATNSYKAVAVGSVLTLDNVKLGYADAATVTAAPRRK